MAVLSLRNVSEDEMYEIRRGALESRQSIREYCLGRILREGSVEASMMAELANRLSEGHHKLHHAVVAAPTILPPVTRGFSPLTIPGVKLGSELAIPDEEEEPAPMCSYREYDTDTGETMQCGRPEHSPKVKHGNWRKI